MVLAISVNKFSLVIIIIINYQLANSGSVLYKSIQLRRHFNASFMSPFFSGSSTNPPNNDGEGAAGTDKNNLVEIDDSGINVKIKQDGRMIQNATLVWTPDNQIRTMENVRIALASSGFDFSLGKDGRLGKDIPPSN